MADEVRARGRRALALSCDVTIYDECRAAVEHTIAHFGRLDILVNNAGGSEQRATVMDSDPHRWTATIMANLASAYYCARAALPFMIEARSGKIINIGSGMGHGVAPGNSAYSASKAGTWMFTQVLAQEVWPHGIDVNEVVPGPVYTKLTEEVFLPDAPPPFAPSERVKRPAAKPARPISPIPRAPSSLTSESGHSRKWTSMGGTSALCGVRGGGRGNRRRRIGRADE